MGATKTSAILLLAMLALSGVSARELQQTFQSGGKCVAKANSSVEKKSKDDFAMAVATAVKKGCSEHLPADQLVEEFISIYQVCAFAIVDVWTKAFADCKTFGKNSFGCASAFAFAKGKTKAYVSLVSAATAEAENNCFDCDPQAYADVFATLLIELFAKAQAQSAANVCVGPSQTASAFAFSQCNAQVLAHGFAFAHARAAIQGGCTSLAAEALAEVDNFVRADPYCKCVGWASVCKNGQCNWTYDSGKYIDETVKAKYPIAWAYFKAECDAFAKEIPAKSVAGTFGEP